MSEDTKSPVETLGDVADEFRTSLPKALIQREYVAPPSSSNKTHSDAASDLPPSGSLRDQMRQSPLPVTQLAKGEISSTPPSIRPSVNEADKNLSVAKDIPDPWENASVSQPHEKSELPPSIRLSTARATSSPSDVGPPRLSNEQLPPQAQPLPSATTAPISTAPPHHIKKDELPPQGEYLSPRTTSVASTMSSEPPAELQERNRLHRKDNDANNQSREIRIDLSASKSMSNLISALALKPGLGAEISVEDRRKNLHHLISESHELTDFICKKIKNNGKVPDYLYGSILQETTRHIAYQWRQGQEIDTHTAKLIATEIFNHENPLLDQFAYDAASQQKRYQLDDVERAELEMHTSVMSAIGRIRSSVLSMRIGQFISGYGENVENLREKYAQTPYLFNQENESKIVTDLTEITLRIAQNNKIDALDDATSMQWNTSMIYRASDLIKSEYEMFVERLVRISFSDISLHEQELNANASSYESAIKNIEKRAESSFNTISNTAKRLMSKTLFFNQTNPDQKTQVDGQTERDKP